MHLDPKALEAATAAYNETIFTSDADHTSRIIRAYLKATIPADVEGLVEELETLKGAFAAEGDNFGMEVSEAFHNAAQTIRSLHAQSDKFMRAAASEFAKSCELADLALDAEAKQFVGEVVGFVDPIALRSGGRWLNITRTKNAKYTLPLYTPLTKEGNGNG